MPAWRKIMLRLAGSNADTKFEELQLKMEKRLKLVERIQIVGYNCFANNNTVHMKGRVLEYDEIKPAQDNDSTWQNLLRSYRRMACNDLPAAFLEVEFNGQKQKVRTDREGYYKLAFVLDKDLRYKRDGYLYKVSLLDIPEDAKIKSATGEGRFFIPPKSADFGVISDVDDTIMKTDVSSLIKMARATFLENARTRIAFKGVGAFYQALRQGKSLKNDNPFFYVSSSPWNLYDLIRDFLHINEIPQGPILLRDFGLDENKLLTEKHGSHKFRKIEKLLNTYPKLNFILIGDSGEKDAYIYYQIAREFPGKILSIYIRDAHVEKNIALIKEIQSKATEEGIEIILVKDSLEAARHALSKGYIDESAIDEIKREKRRQNSNDARNVEVEELLGKS